MKAYLSDWSRRYLAKYEGAIAGHARRAELARDAVEAAARAAGRPLHVVTARPKSPDSLRAKLRRHESRKKLYDNIGTRVICYYVTDIDPVVETLKRQLDWEPSLSADRRSALGQSEFGYRSVHLVARLKDASLGLAPFAELGNAWFEIQVRSVLEHAWAEVEHELRYKAQIRYPLDVERQINAVSGSLELLDRAFCDLRLARASTVADHRGSYLAGREFGTGLDAARLMAFLQVRRPRGLGWIQAEESGSPLRPHSEVACLEALRAVGIDTAADLMDAMSSRRFTNDLLSYASARSIGSDAVAHPVVAVVLAASIDADLILESFPELLFDAELAAVVTRRAQL